MVHFLIIFAVLSFEPCRGIRNETPGNSLQTPLKWSASQWQDTIYFRSGGLTGVLPRIKVGKWQALLDAGFERVLELGGGECGWSSNVPALGFETWCTDLTTPSATLEKVTFYQLNHSNSLQGVENLVGFAKKHAGDFNIVVANWVLNKNHEVAGETAGGGFTSFLDSVKKLVNPDHGIALINPVSTPDGFEAPRGWATMTLPYSDGDDLSEESLIFRSWMPLFGESLEDRIMLLHSGWPKKKPFCEDRDDYWCLAKCVSTLRCQSDSKCISHCPQACDRTEGPGVAWALCLHYESGLERSDMISKACFNKAYDPAKRRGAQVADSALLRRRPNFGPLLSLDLDTRFTDFVQAGNPETNDAGDLNTRYIEGLCVQPPMRPLRLEPLFDPAQ